MCCTRESLWKMAATDLSVRSHWRRKVVVYLQKYSVNSFSKFKFIFSDFIHSQYHNLTLGKHQDECAHVVCPKSEQARTISCLILAFSAGLLLVGGGRVGFGQVCCAISSQQLLYCHFFCLWILLTWYFMSLRWIFFPVIFIFPCLHHLPLLEQGEGSRCGEAGAPYWPSSCSQSTRFPVAGHCWASAECWPWGAVNRTSPSFIAVNGLGYQWVPLF